MNITSSLSKKLNRYFSVLIAALLVTQILPFGTFALALQDDELLADDLYSDVEETSVPDIVSEVKDERDQFTKVYLLEDGSFYSITTNRPTHKQVDGQWTNIDESLDEADTPQKVEDAKALLQEASRNSCAAATPQSRTVQAEDSSLLINKIYGASDLPGGGISFGEFGTLLIKPTSLHYYLNHNKAIMEANLSMSCVAGENHTAGSVIWVREETMAWDMNTNENDYDWDFSKTPLDYVAIDDDGTYNWEITDLYSRWDRGATENNGIVMYTSEICDLALSSICISVRYKEISENDTDSTYHTVDMGRAGKVYINDFTNTARLEQDILGIDGNVFPASIKRFYSLVSPSFSSPAGIGLRWNYESEIRLNDGIASWKMFDGTVKYFVQSDPVITNGDYIKWTDVGKVPERDHDIADLWIKSTEIANPPVNYSNFYVELNGVTFNFNSGGRVITMESDAGDFTISYGTNNSITSIVDGAGQQFLFTYASNGTGYSHVSNVAAQTSTNDPITITDSEGIPHALSVSFTTAYDSGTQISTNQTTYPDGKTVTHKFDYYGNLTEIIGTDNSRLVLEYAEEDSTDVGNRIVQYTKYTTDGSTETVEESLAIDTSNTYQRKFTNQDEKEELIQFDRNFNTTSHRSFEGDYVFATYDDNGIINSFAVPEREPNLLLNNSFELGPGPNFTNWSKVNSDCINKANSSWVNSDHGLREVEFSGDQPFTATLYQNNVGSFVADQTYVVGAWAKMSRAFPSDKRELEIRVYARYEGMSTYTTDPVAVVPFDTCAPDQWQYQLVAFKMDQNATGLRVSIVYDGQTGKAFVDEATLYAAKESQADLSNLVSSSPYEVTKNADGTTASETLSNGVLSMVKSYDYIYVIGEDDKEIPILTSITDSNGITTYYDYNDSNYTLEKVGTLKNGDSIIDPTEFSYNVQEMLEQIEKTITNISSEDPVDLIAKYAYNDSDQISSVTHNGFSYEFNYENGNLTSVDTTSTAYVKSPGEASLIEYGYDSGIVNEIQYKNGLTVTYEYTDGKVSTAEYWLNETLIREFDYTYDGNGDLATAIDTRTGYKIEYTAGGYELSRHNGTEYILLYQSVKNADGSITETYLPDVYTENGTPKDVITTSGNTVTQNTVTGETTTSSTVSANKVSSWLSSTDNDQMQYNYTRQSATDYFGRITQKYVDMETSTINGDTRSKVTADYEYKALGNDVTSNLVSSYTSTVEVFDTLDNSVVYTSVYETLYDYDHKGNVALISREYNDEDVVPLAFYQYDEANQLVGELNTTRALSATYTYDSGGNLTAKIYHDISGAAYDPSTMEITDYGTVTNTISYGYDTVWKDRLTNYNAVSITYDELGNPLNYAAPTYKTSSNSANPLDNLSSDNSVAGSFEWSGQNLTAFETADNRYEYDYDENGYRIRKRAYTKTADETQPGGYSYDSPSEFTYVWDNGTLKSVIIGADGASTLHSDIIYDQEGSLSGFITPSGLPFYFRKDSSENVLGLVDASGNEIITYSYDAWGQLSIVINVDTSTFIGKLIYAGYGLTALLNPATYHGYLFDYESGLYFNQGRCYSPAWGRYLSPDEPAKLLEKNPDVLSTNLYSFCKNNTVNVLDPYGTWSRDYMGLQWMPKGFEVDMNIAFLSRPFCAVFANQIIKASGTWGYMNGYNYLGMDTFRIASDLFAHCVGKNALSAVNKVNATWGDGWILKNSQSNTISVNKDDPNGWKYQKIWYAASDIRMYAWSNGIYITL